MQRFNLKFNNSHLRVLKERERERGRKREMERESQEEWVQQVRDVRCDAKSFPRAFSREIDLKFINIQRRVWKITR